MQKGRNPRGKRSISIGLVGKKSRSGLACYSPGFKRFVMQHEGLLTKAFELLKEFAATNPWEKTEARMERNGIIVSTEATGTYKGGDWIFRVNAAKREFFVKAKKSYISARDMLAGMRMAERFLKSRGHKIGRFNVELVKPLLLYQRKSSERPWLVTKFYRLGEVKQVTDLEGKDAIEVNEAIYSLSKELWQKFRVQEIEPKNAFFRKSTNTILLFDIYCFSDYWRKKAKK